MRDYATKLTKEELLADNLRITKTGQVYRNGKKVKVKNKNDNKYLLLTIYKHDENGDYIKIPIKRNYRGRIVETYKFDCRIVPFHRAIWAWFNGEARQGYVIDHKDNKLNKKLIKNNLIDKLQEITPGENLAKDRELIREIDPNVGGWPSREYITDKIAYYKAKYDAAVGDEDARHAFRSNLSDWNAKLRRFDSDPERYTKKKKVKLVNKCHENARIRKMLKDDIKASKMAYNAARTKENRIIWKEAIDKWKKFELEIKNK